MGHNSLTCIFANAMQQSSSIATATWTQIWPYHKTVKGYPSLIILTNLEDLESSMLFTKIQPQSFLSTGEEAFQEFLPYMDMMSILFNCAEPFEQIGNTLSTEGPCEIWWKLLKQRRRHFKNYTILYMYIAQWQGQITFKGQNFDYN